MGPRPSAGAGTRRCAWLAAVVVAFAEACVEPVPVRPTARPIEEVAAPEPPPVEAQSDDAGPAPADAFERPDAWRRAPRRPSQASLFDPRADAEIVGRLRSEEVIGVERGRGGRSVAFRVTLESGTRAYFKPEQTFSGTQWHAEIAAFHLDRLLGLHRTAPCTGRALPWSLLEPAVHGDPRADEVIVGEDGMVRGALIAWIEERLVPISPPSDWAAALRLTPHVGVDPFVPPRALQRAHAAFLATDAGMPPDAASDAARAVIEAGMTWDAERRAAELSTLVSFDFLIHNGDRWGGGFTNVRTRGAEGPLIYLDNAAGFSRRRARSPTLELRLAFVQRFERSLRRQLRRMDVQVLAERLATDPLAPILDEEALAHLEERREAWLAHVEALISEHGEARVLPW